MSMFIGVNTNFYNNSLSTEGKPTTILARVDKVILGPLDASGNPDPDFKANGGWTSVGSIKYTVLYGSQPLPENSPTVAKPYAINSTHFPVKYEIVELVPGPSIKLNDDSLSKDLYYKKPINLWNNVYHNALPNALTLVQKNSTVAPTYQESIRGANYSATTSSKSISLGDTFPELNYIQNLQPFEGDYIVQGRFGQSIRFGSTVRKGVTLNPWSSAGTNGDPIVIIRNGQGDKRPADIFSNTVEDINKDGASIYLCSGQVVLITDLNAHTLDTFALGTTLQEPQVQRATTPLTSTDTKSPISQSNSELQYAQTSTETVIPSIVPQSKTTIQINQSTTGSTQSFIGPLQPTSSISQPTTGSNPTATVLTQTVMPDGTTLNSSVNVLLDPFGTRNAGKIGVDAINNPNKVPYAPVNQQTGSTLNNVTNNTGQGTSTTTQDVLPEGLEVIVADESTLRLSFDVNEYTPDEEPGPDDEQLKDRAEVPDPPPDTKKKDEFIPQGLKGNEGAMETAMNAVFGKNKGIISRCAQYTYHIAYWYKQALAGGQVSGDFIGGHGNAGDEIYRKNLVKLGYTMYELGVMTKSELIAKIINNTWNIGDIVNYRSLVPTGDNNYPYIYGHTQIYTGGISNQVAPSKSRRQSKWAASFSNNYGSSMVYGGKDSNKWVGYIFRRI